MLITLLGLVLVAASAMYIAWPLLAPSEAEEVAGEHSEAIALEREKEAALAAIAEVDFDHRVGKISDADHAALRADLEARALRALAASDEAAKEPALRALAGDATAPAARTGGGFCPACGHRFQREARFCTRCGKKFSRSGKSPRRRRARS